MTFKHNEIPHNKFLYAYEIVMKDPYDISTYQYIVHRFLNNIERGRWLSKGNRKPLDSPILINKRRNKVHYKISMVQVALQNQYWPVTLIEKDNGKYRLYRKYTGRGLC